MPRRRLASLFFVCAILAAATVSSNGQSNAPYKIGMTYPMTGPQAAVIAEYLPAAELGIADVNRHGGVKGHPLQLITEDTQSSPQGGVAAMRKLAQVDGVQAIMTIYTNVVTAQIPLAEQLKVPILAPVQAPGLMTNAQYGFAHAVGFADVQGVITEYWRNAHAKHVWALLSNNAYGQGISPAARTAARNAGAEYNETFADLDATDFRGLLTRVKDANPDQILVTLQGAPAEGAIIKQVRELGIAAPILDPADLYQSRVWRSGVGPYSEGMLFAGFFVDPAISGDFVRTFRNRVGSEPGFDTAMIYDQVKMFAYAIERGGYNGTAIRDALLTLRGVPSTLGGTITMKPDHTTQMTGVGLWQVKRGKLTPVIAPK
jgi:branched-chain amino acid transport system substrate-binding protein